ncbi:autotransporter outer membrane beta-barrel domain-containing protein [Cupriavidus sp. BIC8F]|uniref:autotransporter family protein n=1 Tax=Cupriavidus sp. BIC8F TaxID=3079014 RepID=UPI002915EA83|nr:autotransporter outer membrane beta-barrel domain-containing protein [Cupriavidus sp. BIC8F]
MVGNTTITATSSNSGATVTTGVLTLDAQYPGSTGPISVQSLNGTALAIQGGSLLITNGAGISTSGVGSAVVVSGATADITGLTINNTGTSSGHGILANPDASVTLRSGNAISVTGTNAIGIGVNNGGIVTATAPVAISAGRAGGFGAAGLYVRGAGSAITVPQGMVLNLAGNQAVGVTSASGAIVPGAIGSGLTINLGSGSGTGTSSTGVLAQGGGSAALNTVTVQGPNVGAGAWAHGSGSHVTLTGSSLITVATAANPAFNSVSLWNPTGTPIFGSVTGFSSAAGLLAVSGGTVTSTDTRVEVPVSPTGGRQPAAGATASLNGTINLTRNTINTTGAGSFGFRIDSGQISASDTRVTTTGGGAAMFINFGPGTISLSNSTVQATGPDTTGLVSLNGTPASTHTVTLSGGSLSSAEQSAILAQGPLVLSASDGASVSGASSLVRTFNQDAFFPQPTNVQLTASGSSTLSGDAFNASASILDIGLTTGSRWTGAAFDVTNANIDATSTWNVTASSNVRQQVSNAGMIAFTPPSAGAYKTLTTHNYAGGGTLRINTFLGTDGSPSDRLVINGGSATGRTGLIVDNTTGQGALTVSNGIQVVDAINGGGTSANAFALARRVVAGPYEYRLFRSSVDGTNEQAWYLRSEKEPDPPPPPPVPPTPPVPPDPLYRPEVGAYLANQRLAAGFLVHSLHDRLGEPQWTEQQTFENDDRKRGAGWIRLVGKDIGSRTSDGNFDVKSTVWLLHGGGDVAQWSMFRGDDRLHLGGMLGYSWGSSTGRASGNPASADSDVQGVNVGVYGTWFQNDETRLGWYTDLWGQYGWYSNHVNGDTLPTVGYDSRVLALSAEAGYAWPPRKDLDWVIEPQGQVIYVHGSEGGITEPNGTRVDGERGGGVITRLGVRMHRTWIRQSGERIQPYLTLNWWHDSVDNVIAFNQVSLRDLYPRNRYEVKLGINVQGRKGWTGWSNAGWQWGTQAYHAFIGRVGVKYTW